jgi:hypothetical protein
MAIRGTLPGLYNCVVTISRRTSDYVTLSEQPPLVALLRALGRKLEPLFQVQFDTPCQRMVAGVSLNGRKYKQGDRYICLTCFKICVTHTYTLLTKPVVRQHIYICIDISANMSYISYHLSYISTLMSNISEHVSRVDASTCRTCVGATTLTASAAV